MEIWWTLHLERELASVPLARRILLSTLATAGVAEGVAQDLALALTEACANAVEHARGDDGFQVTAALDGELLRIEVVDSGPGLPAAPRLLPPPPHRPLTRLPQPSGGGAPVLAPRGHPRRRRGRASLPAPGPAHRSRSTAYDVHVLPPRRAAPAAPRLPDPDHFPDPTAESGRGLLLIRALTDQVRLHNHPQRGAIISFEKHLTPAPDPLLRVAS